MMIKDGTGLYTSMILSPYEPTRISFDDNANANVSLSLEQRDLNLYKVSKMDIFINNTLSLRNPSFMIDGNATFKKVFSGQLRGETGIEGQDLIVDGKSSFDVLMADSSILAKNISIDGRKEVNPPILSFNEFRPIDTQLTVSQIYSVPQVVRGLLTLPIVISIILMLIPQSRAPSSNGPYWKRGDGI